MEKLFLLNEQTWSLRLRRHRQNSFSDVFFAAEVRTDYTCLPQGARENMESGGGINRKRSSEADLGPVSLAVLPGGHNFRFARRPSEPRW